MVESACQSLTRNGPVPADSLEKSRPAASALLGMIATCEMYELTASRNSALGPGETSLIVDASTTSKPAMKRFQLFRIASSAVARS